MREPVRTTTCLLLLLVACGDPPPPPAPPRPRPSPSETALSQMEAAMTALHGRLATLATPSDVDTLPGCADTIPVEQRAQVVAVDRTLVEAIAAASLDELPARLSGRAAPPSALWDAIALRTRAAEAHARAAEEPTEELRDWELLTGLAALAVPAEHARTLLEAMSATPYVAVVEALDYDPPDHNEDLTFRPGRYRGRVVVYDATGRAVCANGVDAESSYSVDTVSRGAPGWSVLDLDLVDRALGRARSDLMLGTDVPMPRVGRSTRSRPRARAAAAEGF